MPADIDESLVQASSAPATPAQLGRKSFDPAKLGWGDQVKLVSGSVVPRPVALVTTLGPDGANAAPFSAFNIVSFMPPMVMFSIGPGTKERKDEEKDTILNLRHLPECVIHVGDYETREMMNTCSVEHPRGVDEIALAGFTIEPSVMVQPPRLRECPVQFECKVDRIIELGTVPYYLVIAEIILIHFREDIVNERLYVDNYAMDPIGRLANAGGYARVRENIFIMPFPTSGTGEPSKY